MKLKNLLPEIERRYALYVKDKEFRYFLAEGKSNHWYRKDFATWAANVLKNALFKPDEICEWYKQYDCNDTHITTVFKHFIKERGII